MKKTTIAIICIILLATFFRFWNLSIYPPGLYPDIAINGNNAIDSLQNHDFKLFYPENNGREGLFMWFISLSFLLLGKSIFAIRAVSAFFGVLTILGTYLLAKELFKKNIALLSSFLLAISFWHVNFSRMGFRVILVPFALVFAFYFLFKGLKEKRVYGYIVSGFFFAFGFYAYISYRFVIFIIITILILYIKENKKGLIYSLSSTLLFSLPIGIYFLFNLQDFFGRAVGVSIFSQTNPLLSFLKSLVVHLGMFNVVGDLNWRHNYSGQPELLFPVGIMFLMGIILAIVNIKKKENIFLLSWFFFMLLPSLLTYEGIPHALRTLGVIPAVFIFAGKGGIFFFEKLKPYYKEKRILYALVILFLVTLTYVEFLKYVEFSNKKETREAFSENYVNLGNYLNSLPDNTEKYVVVNASGVLVNNIPMPAQTPIFIEKTKYDQPRARYIPENQLDNITSGIVIPMQENQDILRELINKFPEGRLDFESNFWVFKI